MKGTPQRLAWRLNGYILTIHTNKDCSKRRLTKEIEGVECIHLPRKYSMVIEIGEAFLLPVCKQGTINRIIEKMITLIFGGDGSHVDVYNLDELEKESKASKSSNELNSEDDKHVD